MNSLKTSMESIKLKSSMIISHFAALSLRPVDASDSIILLMSFSKVSRSEEREISFIKPISVLESNSLMTGCIDSQNSSELRGPLVESLLLRRSSDHHKRESIRRNM